MLLGFRINTENSILVVVVVVEVIFQLDECRVV